jgi:hypothetical protein
MNLVVDVALIGSVVVGRHFITPTATCTTPARGRVDTAEAFLDATATYRRGSVAFEVFATAFTAG